MKNGFTLLVFIFVAVCLYGLSACNMAEGRNKKKTSGEMTYSYACLDSAVSNNKTNRVISKTTDIIRDMAIDKDEITDEMQTQYGAAFHQDAIETKTFVLLDDPVVTAQLKKVMDELLAQREAPSRIKYFIYLLDDKAINAFTFGGRIYVTKGMYEKCKGNPALLYSIIGHEIGHSEKGHIKKTIQEMMLSNQIFGERDGDLFLYLKKLLTASFNQRNELEADYYGTDLTYRLNQDVCSAVSFWQAMAREENEYSKLEDFFRSHPFSSLRAQCLRDHIQSNFGANCAGN